MSLPSSRLLVKWRSALKLRASFPGEASVLLRSSRHSRIEKRQFYGFASKPSYPVTSLCPDPTCACAPMPALEPGIDHKGSMANTAPFYGQHVVICTGKSDWTSKIEDEDVLGDEGREGHNSKKPRQTREDVHPGNTVVGFTRGLKMSVGRRSRWFNRSPPVLVTNSSFPRPPPSTAAAYLFPSFTYVSGIPHTLAAHSAFADAYLSSTSPHPPQQPAAARPFSSTPFASPTVLICSHGTRDARCGTLGPLLHASFATALARSGFQITDAAPRADAMSADKGIARVAMVSHVGGHKWAGNVIVYLPPAAGAVAAAGVLAGRGVWYGRVEPKHVEGIVKETILEGRVIEELCRGVV